MHSTQASADLRHPTEPVRISGLATLAKVGNMTSMGDPLINWNPSLAHHSAIPLGGNTALGNGGQATRIVDSTKRLAASFELMAALLDGAGLVDALNLVVRRAQPMAGADLAFIALPGEATSTLTIDIAVGTNADHIRGLTVRTGTSVIGRAFTGRRTLAARVAADTTLKGLPPGPILLLPLDTGERTCGVLGVVGRPQDLPFNSSIRRQLSIFAATSANLIDIAEERRATYLG